MLLKLVFKQMNLLTYMLYVVIFCQGFRMVDLKDDVVINYLVIDNKKMENNFMRVALTVNIKPRL